MYVASTRALTISLVKKVDNQRLILPAEECLEVKFLEDCAKDYAESMVPKNANSTFLNSVLILPNGWDPFLFRPF